MRKIVLLGHGIGVKRVIDTLIDNEKLDSRVVAVFTHPREGHARDLEMIESRKEFYGDCSYNVFQVTADYGIPLHETANVNEEQSISLIKSYKPDYLISIGCRDIIRKRFLDEFSGRVYNIHTTPLPRYRGAASDTWMILNGEWEKELHGCFHVIDEGIDTGPIIAKELYSFPRKSYPVDVFKVRMSIFPALIEKALKKLNSGIREFEQQDVSLSTTFPRLYTPLDGKIDFRNWHGQDIEKFVYAFGYPFEGAHCSFLGKKINILEAEFIPESPSHPFCFGLVVGKNTANQYKILVEGGYLLLKKVEIEGILTDQRIVFRLGRRLE